MSWRYHGRARVDPTNPQAFAVCDRCKFLYNHVDLNWQYQWVGPQLHNLRELVCSTCMDSPQEQLRTIILPPDPMPIWNARPEDYQAAEVDRLTTQDGSPIVTQEDDNIVTQQQTDFGGRNE
jgi:hypothetical protein